MGLPTHVAACHQPVNERRRGSARYSKEPAQVLRHHGPPGCLYAQEVTQSEDVEFPHAHGVAGGAADGCLGGAVVAEGFNTAAL